MTAIKHNSGQSNTMVNDPLIVLEHLSRVCDVVIGVPAPTKMVQEMADRSAWEGSSPNAAPSLENIVPVSDLLLVHGCNEERLFCWGEFHGAC